MKVRGYRIEPGEITAVLEQHPAIEASFVAACSGDSGETRLIAYIVPVANAHFSAGNLRTFLSEHLPEYMVPSVFVTIASLPLTAHGKIDRKALPAPTSENILRDEALESPQSEIEQWLASFLARLLGTTRVSRDDNFFNLGGTLMLADLPVLVVVAHHLLRVRREPGDGGIDGDENGVGDFAAAEGDAAGIGHLRQYGKCRGHKEYVL